MKLPTKYLSSAKTFCPVIFYPTSISRHRNKATRSHFLFEWGERADKFHIFIRYSILVYKRFCCYLYYVYSILINLNTKKEKKMLFRNDDNGCGFLFSSFAMRKKAFNKKICISHGNRNAKMTAAYILQVFHILVQMKWKAGNSFQSNYGKRDFFSQLLLNCFLYNEIMIGSIWLM